MKLEFYRDPQNGFAGTLDVESGVEFYDARTQQQLFLQAVEAWKGAIWLHYRAGGNWVTMREATDDDIRRIEAAQPPSGFDYAFLCESAVGELPDNAESKLLCRHMNFSANVEVARLEDSGRFMAHIKVHCTECGTPFSFKGLPCGVDLNGAAVSVDGREARIAISPVMGGVLGALTARP